MECVKSIRDGMMKFALISDIHGNVKALKKFINYIEEANINKVLNLGDIMGGIEPREVLRLIMKDERFINVEGNHDKVFYGIEESLVEEEKKWLLSLKKERIVTIKDKKILMVHSRIGDNRGIPLIYNNGRLIEFLNDYEGEWDYVLFGHTHYQCYLSFYEGKVMINPGSLGLSYDNKISFAIVNIDEGYFSIEFKKLDY